MNYINFNGKLMQSGTAIVDADNRGLRFGDGLFETIKFRDGELQLINEHLDRLWQGLAAFKFNLPALFTKEMIRAEIEKLLRKNKLSHARVRLTVIRGKGGLYDAEHHQPNFIIQSWQLDENFGKMNSNGLQLCFYEDARKACDMFSPLKHNNFLPYLMGALFAKNNRCNDAVILNQHERVCDTTIANIFFIRKNKLYTVPLSEGCIAGTMRQLLLDTLTAKGYLIEEQPVTKALLLEADEIFLTNAMTPMKWVAALAQKEFTHKKTLDIYHDMRQTFPRIFC